ncbi:unnamed protein product [Penicillium camemberti]|uniref:Str. FM013 n=1 Tax=Penicillium camemberti (strain FM 013) TaxID=1429867 RepID=A0A0G4NSR4_PENC3|nr:unnamed protein product [Penicillium camemberti]
MNTMCAVVRGVSKRLLNKYLTRDGAIVEVQHAVNDGAQFEGRFEGREGS